MGEHHHYVSRGRLYEEAMRFVEHFQERLEGRMNKR